VPLTASLFGCVVQRDDGIGGAILGRLLTRAYAMKSGELHVYTPMSPNNHLTGGKTRVKDLVGGRGPGKHGVHLQEFDAYVTRG
jgi:hypothetical protein